MDKISIILLAVLLLFSCSQNAQIKVSNQITLNQQITNVQQKIENGRIVITYDLNGAYEYTVSIKAKNNQGKQITPAAVAGDIGQVTPGRNKTIFWEPLLEGLNLEEWKVELTLKYKENLMIFVQGGTFQMGSNSGDSDEKPVHTVTVNDFYIGKYEVTQKEWKEVMGSNPSNWKGDNLPVEQVSWYDAVEFCNKKSRKEGLTPCYSGSGKSITCNFNANGYRLPTEAEWEYAARGGNKSKGYKYSGSNSIGDVAWYSSSSGNKTHQVGTKRQNELGIYDMTGNVWEWCWDWKGSYSSNSQTNPKGASSGSGRVVRGGSWRNGTDYCRVAYRDCNYPVSSFSSRSMGFRVARSSKQDGFLGLNRSVSCSRFSGQRNEENRPVSRLILESRNCFN